MAIDISVTGLISSKANYFTYGESSNTAVKFQIYTDIGKGKFMTIPVSIFNSEKVNNQKLINSLTENKFVQVLGKYIMTKVNKNEEVMTIIMDRIEFININTFNGFNNKNIIIEDTNNSDFDLKAQEMADLDLDNFFNKE